MSNAFAVDVYKRQEDKCLADLITLLGRVDRAFRQFLLDARIFTPQIFVDQAERNLAEFLRLLRIQEELV